MYHDDRVGEIERECECGTASGSHCLTVMRSCGSGKWTEWNRVLITAHLALRVRAVYVWHEFGLRELLHRRKRARGELHVSESGRWHHGTLLLRVQWLEVLLRWPQQLFPLRIWIHVVAEVRACKLLNHWWVFHRIFRFIDGTWHWCKSTCIRQSPERSESRKHAMPVFWHLLD